MLSQYYSIAEAAQKLSFSKATIERALRDKAFPNAKKMGNTWRIPEEDIREHYKITEMERPVLDFRQIIKNMKKEMGEKR